MSYQSSILPGNVGNTPNYAGLAARNQRNRRGIINLGLSQINSIFDGGTSPFYSLANPNKGSIAGFSAKNPYFYQNKQGNFAPYRMPGDLRNGVFNSAIGATPMLGGAVGAIQNGDYQNSMLSVLSGGTSDLIGGMGGMFGHQDSPTDIERKRFRAGKLYSMTPQTFEGFTPAFYQKRAQAYVDNAMPQLANQYRNTRASLDFGLANRGLLKSSAANVQGSELERETGQAKQQIADTGQTEANQTKQQVENARSQAISYLYQTADPASASQQAIGQAANFQAPSSFAPLANMFSNLLSQYYTNQVLGSGGTPSYVMPPSYSTNSGAVGPVSY
jgi:hypothetical protein